MDKLLGFPWNLIAGVVVLGLLAWGVAHLWETQVAQPYVDEGIEIGMTAAAEAHKKELVEKLGVETVDQAALVLSKFRESITLQNDAINALRADAARRERAAADARKKSEAALAELNAQVQAILSEKPAFPDNPCESACRVLLQPL